METVEIKFWRFAYTSYEMKCKIPKQLKFYKIFQENPIIDKLGHENQTWISVVNFDKKLYNWLLNNTHDFDVYNWCNKYIAVVFDQFTVLSGDWQETSEEPKIEPFYLKRRNMKTPIDWNAIDKNLTGEELLELVCPPYVYIRVNKIHYSTLNVTWVNVKDPFDTRKESFMISENTVDFDNLIKPYDLNKTEFSNKNEFDESVKLALEKMNIRQCV